MSFDTPADFNESTPHQWQFTTDTGNNDTGKKIDKSESSPFFKDSINVGRGDPIFIGKLDYTNPVDFPKLWDPPNNVNSPEFRDLWGWAINGDLSKTLSQTTEGKLAITANHLFSIGVFENNSPDSLTESNPLAPLNEIQISALSKEYGVSPEQIRVAYFFAQANPTVPLEEPMKTIVPQIQQQSTPMPGESQQFSQAFETVLDGASSDISALASQMGITIEQATQLLKDAAAMSANPTTGSAPPAGPAMELFLKLESEAKAMVGAQKEGYAFERELDFGSTQITALAQQQGVDPANLKASLQSLQGLAQLAQKLDMPIADLRNLLASGDSGIQQVISLGEKVGLDSSTTQRAIDAIPSEALSENIPAETDEMASHLVTNANKFLNTPAPDASTSFLQFISPPTDDSSGAITEIIQEKITSLANQLQISVEECKKLLITAQQNPTAQVPKPIRALANEIMAQAEHSASMREIVQTTEQSFEALINSKDGPAANSIEQLSRLMRCSPEDVISKIRLIHADPQAAPAGPIGARLSLLLISLESQSVQYAVSTVQSKIDPKNVNVLIDNAYGERLDLAIRNAGAEDVKFQIYFAIQNPELAQTLDPKIVSLAQSIQTTVSSQISEKLGIPKEWASSSLPGGDIGSILYSRTVEDKLFELSLNGKITPEEMNQLRALHNMLEQSAPTTPRLAELLKKIENDALQEVREQLGAPPDWEPKNDSTAFQTIVTQDYKSTVYANLKTKEKTEGIKLDHVLSSLQGSDIKLGPDDKKTLDDIKQQSLDEIGSKYNLNVDKRDSSEGTEKIQKSSGRASIGGQVTGVAVDVFTAPIAALSNARSLQRADTMRLVLDGLSDAIDHLTRATALNNVEGSTGPVLSSYSDYILITRNALNLMKQVSNDIQATNLHISRISREGSFEKRMSQLTMEKTAAILKQEALEKAREAGIETANMGYGMLALNIIVTALIVAAMACMWFFGIGGILLAIAMSLMLIIQVLMTICDAPGISDSIPQEFKDFLLAASIITAVATCAATGGASMSAFLANVAETIAKEGIIKATLIALKAAFQAIKDIVMAVVRMVTEMMSKLIDLVKQISIRALKELIMSAIKAMENAFQLIIKAATELPGKTLRLIKELPDKIVTAFKNAMETIQTTTPKSIAESMRANAVASVQKTSVAEGREIIKAAEQAADDAIQQALQIATEAAQEAQKAKDALQAAQKAGQGIQEAQEIATRTARLAEEAAQAAQTLKEPAQRAHTIAAYLQKIGQAPMSPEEIAVLTKAEEIANQSGQSMTVAQRSAFVHNQLEASGFSAVSQAEQAQLIEMQINISYLDMVLGASNTTTTFTHSIMEAITKIANAEYLLAQAEATEEQAKLDAIKIIANMVVNYLNSLAESMMDDMKKQGEKISRIAKDQADFWTKLSGMLSKLYQV